MEFIYKGLKAQVTPYAVTDEEVEHQLQRLLTQSPQIIPITDRPAALGDEVILDYAGFCDGVQFPGGTAEMQSLTLGSGMFIPGFEEQLVGAEVGQDVSVQVRFPKAYHAEELAGKDAEFKCHIHEIRTRTPYELSDTFAREVGGCENMAEMRVQLKKSMQAYADERGEMDLQDRLLRQAAETLELTFDAEAVEQSLDEQMQVLGAQLARQGVNMEMYCQFLGKSEEELRREMVPAAENALRAQAAIDRIVEAEKLEAEQAEIAEALALICRQNNMTLEEMKPHYNAEMEQAVIRSVLTTKAMRLIRDAAVIETV